MYEGPPTEHIFTTNTGKQIKYTTTRGLNAGDPLAMAAFCGVVWEEVGSVLYQEFPDVITPSWADDMFTVSYTRPAGQVCHEAHQADEGQARA